MLIFILCFIEGSYAFLSLLFGYMVLESELIGPCLCVRLISAFPRTGERLSSSPANAP